MGFTMAPNPKKRIADHVGKDVALRYIEDTTVDVKGDRKNGVKVEVLEVLDADGGYRDHGTTVLLQTVLIDQMHEIDPGEWVGGHLAGPDGDRRYYSLEPTGDPAPFRLAVEAFETDELDRT